MISAESIEPKTSSKASVPRMTRAAEETQNDDVHGGGWASLELWWVSGLCRLTSGLFFLQTPRIEDYFHLGLAVQDWPMAIDASGSAGASAANFDNSLDHRVCLRGMTEGNICVSHLRVPAGGGEQTHS